MALRVPAEQRREGSHSQAAKASLLYGKSPVKCELGLGKFTAAGTENKYQVLEGRTCQAAGMLSLFF